MNIFSIFDSFASFLQKRKVLEESGAAPEGQQQQPKVIRQFPQTRPVSDNAAGGESRKRRLSKDILAGVSIFFTSQTRSIHVSLFFMLIRAQHVYLLLIQPLFSAPYRYLVVLNNRQFSKLILRSPRLFFLQFCALACLVKITADSRNCVIMVRFFLFARLFVIYTLLIERSSSFGTKLGISFLFPSKFDSEAVKL